MPRKTRLRKKTKKPTTSTVVAASSVDAPVPPAKNRGRKRKSDPDQASVTSKVGRVTRSKSGTVKKPIKTLVSVTTTIDTDPEEKMVIDDVLEDVEDQSDEDSVSDEELEEILAGFDGEGKPIENLNDPIDFHLTRQKRFRKPYVPQALPETQLFTKHLKGLTRSLGKMDTEKRFCSLVRSAGTVQLQRGSGPPKQLEAVVENDSKGWVLTQLQRTNSGTPQTLSIDVSYDYLRSSFGSIWNQLLGKHQKDRIQNFIDSFSKTVQQFNLGYLGTLARNLSLQMTLCDWENQLERKICEKNTVIDYWFRYRNWLTEPERIPEFEESGPGLKLLRRSLDVPYFKTWLGNSSAPSIFPKTDTTSIISKTLSAKKKWTTKDVAGLRTCILKTVQEAKVTRVHRLATVMIQFFKGNQADDETTADILEEINQTDGQKKDVKGTKRSKKKSNTSVTLSPAIVVESKEFPEALRTCKDVGEVRKWLAEEKKNKNLTHLKYDQVFNDGFTSKEIDWNVVSTKLMNRTKKFRAPEDCKMCFEHAANPMYETKRSWSELEKNILKEKAAAGEEWSDISKSLGGKPRPDFLVYYKWYKTCKPRKVIWTKSQETVVRNLIQTSSWDKVAIEVGNPLVTKKHVQERFKKVLNPVLRFGKFTRVEDSLMMLTLEKLKGQFEREKHFGIMTAYLPWRYESAWRDRAENLFAEYIVPWTIEEDTELMDLAIHMRRDWSRIAKTFTSFKTRKGCLTRHKILQKRLQDGTTLEQYHHSYAMIRYNVREYRHLKDISTLLKDILLVDVPQLKCQPALARDRPPLEEELEDLILTFDRDIMSATIRVIDTYLAARDEFWTDWRIKNNVEPGQMKKTHDRRTFHPENTQSIASALHIRGVKLIPKGSLPFKLSQRETEVYGFYAQFCSTKPLKKDKPRPYIPLAEDLMKLDDVKRICVKRSTVARTSAATPDTAHRKFPLTLTKQPKKLDKDT